MVPLTPLESEVLGLMSWDSYHLGEIVSVVRGFDRLQDEYSVYRTLTALLESWIARGWLMLAARPTFSPFLTSVEQVVPYLEAYGLRAIAEESDVALPELELTEQAFRDVEWLRGVV
jgi:hypothetical protein